MKRLIASIVGGIALGLGGSGTSYLWNLWDMSRVIQTIANSGRWDAAIGMVFVPGPALFPLVIGLTITLLLFDWAEDHPIARREEKR